MATHWNTGILGTCSRQLRPQVLSTILLLAQWTSHSRSYHQKQLSLSLSLSLSLTSLSRLITNSLGSRKTCSSHWASPGSSFIDLSWRVSGVSEVSTQFCRFRLLILPLFHTWCLQWPSVLVGPSSDLREFPKVSSFSWSSSHCPTLL